MAYYGTDKTVYLAHFGIKGQKWGVRKYQNPDGSLTEEGRKRYGVFADRVNQRGIAKVNYDKAMKKASDDYASKKEFVQTRKNLPIKAWAQADRMHQRAVARDNAKDNYALEKRGAKSLGDDAEGHARFRANRSKFGESGAVRVEKRIQKGIPKGYANLAEYGVQFGKNAATSALIGYGSVFAVSLVANAANAKKTDAGKNLLENTETIGLKPWQYKVSKL